MIALALGVICLGWYIFILFVVSVGIFRIHRSNARRPSPSPRIAAEGDEEATCPHVTIIRPVVGLEPYLYECLASTFQQNYPSKLLTIYFCLPNRRDPALPTLRRLIADHPEFNAQILIEDEDQTRPRNGGSSQALGPNPKIRNMSRAYRDAKSDIVWIVDCNVWVGRIVAGEMIDLLCGLRSGKPSTRRKFKFVHQLPLSVDVSEKGSQPPIRERASEAGGLLEETFLSTSHAKFYAAINTVAVAPCIVGKSNMFRRSHLDALTAQPTQMNPDPSPLCGIDHFSSNICEDHLIGSLLWTSKVPAQVLRTAECEGFKDGEHQQDVQPDDRPWGNHAMLTPTSPDNLAIQPTANYSLRTYIDRRVRWLRVRKFTVTLATLVEPGTESFLCSAYGAFGLTTISWFNRQLHVPQTWSAFCIFWLLNVILWACVDRWVSRILQRINVSDGPSFASVRATPRPLKTWIAGWIGREALAFPIWAWAVFGGVTVIWRGQKFWVGYDMQVHAISSDRERDDRVAASPPSNAYRDDSGSGGESGRKRRMD